LTAPPREGDLPIPDSRSILVVPLGGVGQIGMNWTLYGHDGSWLLVDAGSGFAPRDLPLVDAVFPDVNLIKSILPRLKGLVVTHAHEDHIGAIHRLWPKFINCPIYVTPFAKAALKGRFEERGTDDKIKFRTIVAGNLLTIGPFKIRPINMTHSIPECVSLAIKTPAGTVFHTGDWKFDPNPGIGKPTDFASIKRIGREGVLAMICDSTNAIKPGKITSEAMVAESMKQAFNNTRGMVVVSCFATNVARMASVIKAAAATNRKVAIAGRTLVKYEEIARNLGMLKGLPQTLRFPSHLKGLDRNQMTLICTGAQGESNAALAKLSTGENPRLPEVLPGDAIIHSARPIPGNEDDIYGILDRFREMGAEVYEGAFEGMPLHVTGHATSTEIETMYEMVKPRFAIPVHGEEAHLFAHAKLATGKGVEKVAIPQEGGVYAVSSEGIQKIMQLDIKLDAELNEQDHTIIRWDEDEVRETLRRIEEQESALAAQDTAPSVGMHP
jgi:ribonuclease J